MKVLKARLMTIAVVLLLSSCAQTQHQTAKPTRYLGPTAEHQLIGRIIEVLNDDYIDPVSYQELMVGAVQGLEKKIGQTGLLSHKDGNYIVISPRMRESYTFMSENEFELDLFLKGVFDIVEYVEATNTSCTRLEIVESMARGMLSVPKYKCNLISPDELKLSANMSNIAAQTGLSLFIENSYPTVSYVGCGSPSQKAGVRKGDIIVAINGVPTKGLDMATVIERLENHKEDSLELEIAKSLNSLSEKIQIIRAHYNEKTVYLGSVKNKYAHIWVKRFGESTVEELSNTFAMFKNDASLDGIILDLRFNEGGVLIHAIKIAELFMHDHVVFTKTKGKSPKHTRVLTAWPPRSSKNKKMVVLTNEITAGGAEILTAALQDYGLAIVIGTQTCGAKIIKGFASLPLGYSIIYPVAKSYRPKHQKIQDDHVQPDIWVDTESNIKIEDLCELKTDELVEKAFKVLETSKSAKHKDMLEAASRIE